MNKEKRTGLSLNADTARAVQEIQKHLEKQVGFSPSMSQVIEFLVRDYQGKTQQSQTKTN